MASIIVAPQNKQAGYLPLGRRTSIIGRGENANLQVLDDRVSRRHLQIRYDDPSGNYLALDMKSSNGVYVNEQKIEGETVLAEGDKIRVGSTDLLFTLEDFPDRESALAHFKKVGERRRSTLTQ